MTPNPWIEHIRKYASKHNLSYFEALRDPKVKQGYKKKGLMKGGALSPQDKQRLINRANQLTKHIQNMQRNKAYYNTADNFTRGGIPDKLIIDIWKVIDENPQVSFSDKLAQLDQYERDDEKFRLLSRVNNFTNLVDDFQEEGKIPNDMVDGIYNQLDAKVWDFETQNPLENAHDELTEMEKQLRSYIQRTVRNKPNREPDAF